MSELHARQYRRDGEDEANARRAMGDSVFVIDRKTCAPMVLWTYDPRRLDGHPGSPAFPKSGVLFPCPHDLRLMRVAGRPIVHYDVGSVFTTPQLARRAVCKTIRYWEHESPFHPFPYDLAIVSVFAGLDKDFPYCTSIRFARKMRGMKKRASA